MHSPQHGCWGNNLGIACSFAEWIKAPECSNWKSPVIQRWACLLDNCALSTSLILNETPKNSKKSTVSIQCVCVTCESHPHDKETLCVSADVPWHSPSPSHRPHSQGRVSSAQSYLWLRFESKHLLRRAWLVQVMWVKIMFNCLLRSKVTVKTMIF